MLRVSPGSSAQARLPHEKLRAVLPVEQRRTAPAEPVADGVVSDRWPTLARAMGRYEGGVAEVFSRLAYERVEGGVIRLDDRRWLARRAQGFGIRPFDAQLLIACAVRKRALDGMYDATPSLAAPRLSARYRWWRQMWMRWGLVAGVVLAVEGMIAWRWMGW